MLVSLPPLPVVLACANTCSYSCLFIRGRRDSIVVKPTAVGVVDGGGLCVYMMVVT